MKQTTNDVEREMWDAVIIGAGPAGALVAREVARRGMKALLVESKVFPRDKVCGGSINGRALTALQSVGLGTLCSDLGGRKIASVEIRTDRQRLRISLPTGMAVSRRALDAALVREAISEGTEFLSETTATVAPSKDDDCRRLLLRRNDSTAFTARAKVVLACDGLGLSSLRHLSRFRSRVARRARIGVGGIAADASDTYKPGQIIMAVSRRGYVGMTHVEGNQLCIASALDVDVLRELNARDAVIEILHDTGTPVTEAVRQTSFRGTPALTHYRPHLAAERLFVLGDGASYVEPFTGEGMAMAWIGAILVAPLAARGVASWNPGLAKEWQQIYRNAIGKQLKICRLVTSLIRHPWAVRATLAVLNRYPNLCEPIVGRINLPPRTLKACSP